MIEGKKLFKRSNIYSIFIFSSIITIVIFLFCLLPGIYIWLKNTDELDKMVYNPHGFLKYNVDDISDKRSSLNLRVNNNMYGSDYSFDCKIHDVKRIFRDIDSSKNVILYIKKGTQIIMELQTENMKYTTIEEYGTTLSTLFVVFINLIFFGAISFFSFRFIRKDQRNRII